MVFSASKKDEPISEAKLRNRGPRLFMVANMYMTLALRKYFLTFVRLQMRNQFIIGAAAGMNCESVAWKELYEFVTAHGVDRIIAGDYNNYDQRMSAIVVLEAFRVIIEICEISGKYTHGELCAMRVLAREVAQPLCEVDGDIYRVNGTNPSGQALTTIINCVVNVLYMRFCWVKAGYDVRDFAAQVHLMTYGDDNIMGVSKLAPNFNYNTIALHLAEIGVKYTTSDKQLVSKNYDTIGDVGFLKRTFRVVDNHVFAPLDSSSIYKTTQLATKSRHVTDEVHRDSCLMALVRNAQMSEPDLREYIRSKVQSLVSWPVQTFDSFMEDYVQNSADYRSATGYTGAICIDRLVIHVYTHVAPYIKSFVAPYTRDS
jgi:hypothetical protein